MALPKLVGADWTDLYKATRGLRIQSAMCRGRDAFLLGEAAKRRIALKKVAFEIWKDGLVDDDVKHIYNEAILNSEFTSVKASRKSFRAVLDLTGELFSGWFIALAGSAGSHSILAASIRDPLSAVDCRVGVPIQPPITLVKGGSPFDVICERIKNMSEYYTPQIVGAAVVAAQKSAVSFDKASLKEIADWICHEVGASPHLRDSVAAAVDLLSDGDISTLCRAVDSVYEASPLKPIIHQAMKRLVDGSLVSHIGTENPVATTTTETPVMTTTTTSPSISIESAIESAIDALLASKGVKISQLLEAANALVAKDLEAKAAYKTLSESKAHAETLKETVARLEKELMAKPRIAFEKLELPSYASVPKGEARLAMASDLFKGPKGETSKHLKFEVPCFEWEHPHPDVPKVDPHYKFRMNTLIPVLYALVNNSPMWVYGHSGTGKTTLIEQVAARLGWPVKRVNMDNEIERSDFLGREVLTTDPETKQTVSKFVEGVLPQAMQHPYIFLTDEADFGKSGVMYVMQRALEKNGLMLTEDGGRLIVPHTFFRFVATANTRGQGDEFGAYPGARPQSAALLDRYTTWVEVGYLDQADERQLIIDRVPGIDTGLVDKMMMFAKEMRKAFLNGEIIQPLSPRGLVQAADFIAFFQPTMPLKELVPLAISSAITAKATEDSRQKLTELMLRTLG